MSDAKPVPTPVIVPRPAPPAPLLDQPPVAPQAQPWAAAAPASPIVAPTFDLDRDVDNSDGVRTQPLGVVPVAGMATTTHVSEAARSEGEIDASLRSITRRTTLEELERAGKTKNLKTLSEKQLKEWIREALRRVISTSTTIGDDERERLVARTRDELGAVMAGERQATDGVDAALRARIGELEAALADAAPPTDGEVLDDLRDEKNALAADLAQVRRTLARRLTASAAICAALIEIDRQFYAGEHQRSVNESAEAAADPEAAFYADEAAAGTTLDALARDLAALHQRISTCVPELPAGSLGLLPADLERLHDMEWTGVNDRLIGDLNDQLRAAQAAAHGLKDRLAERETAAAKAQADLARVNADLAESRALSARLRLEAERLERERVKHLEVEASAAHAADGRVAARVGELEAELAAVRAATEARIKELGADLAAARAATGLAATEAAARIRAEERARALEADLAASRSSAQVAAARAQAHSAEQIRALEAELVTARTREAAALRAAEERSVAAVTPSVSPVASPTPADPVWQRAVSAATGAPDSGRTPLGGELLPSDIRLAALGLAAGALVAWRDPRGHGRLAAVLSGGALAASRDCGPVLGTPCPARGAVAAPFAVYTSADGHVQLVDEAQVVTDLTALLGVPLAAGGASAWVWDAEGSRHIAFRDGRGAIHELLDLDGTWRHADLSAHTGCPAAAADPVGYAPADHEHVLFRGEDDGVHELCFDGRRWVHHALSSQTGAPVAVGRPAGAYVAGWHVVAYRDQAGAVHLLRLAADWRHHLVPGLGMVLDELQFTAGPEGTAAMLIATGEDGLLHRQALDVVDGLPA